jgi:A/G-specific adenine glycosylase
MPRNTNEFAAKLPRFHRALLKWYEAHGRRDLPWRNTRDPYRIYISEIMLQQTQVKTVLERYYEPFLKRFPTLAALGQAGPEAVVKQWEGLGYYTRARNLYAAAQQCRGILPSSPEALLALPGIGRNTANAIACFGFGLAVPVMEANVKRVLARVFALKVPDEKLLWEKAALLMDIKHAFDYNQAMMDIGATVCTKRNPRCGECPLAMVCEGKASPQSYPLPKRKRTPPVRKRAIIVFADAAGRYYLKRRDARFLHGLYGFMEVEADAPHVLLLGKRHTLVPQRLLGAVTQAYSHFTLEAKVYLVPVAQLPPDGVAAGFKEMRRLPLSRADHKIVKLLEAREGGRR